MRPEQDCPLSIRLFGSFEVRVRGRPLPGLRFRRGQSVLALLALRRGCEVEREWLAGVLWPGSAQTVAMHNLRNCLTALRHGLGPEASRLRSPTPRTLSLDLTSASVDVLTFDAAIARGSSGWEALQEATSLYRGPLLEGWTEEWVFQERQAREQAYLTALEGLAAVLRARGRAAEAERYLRLSVVTDPVRESAQRALMELLASRGNYAAALLAYRELRQRLHQEVNAQPDPETQALFQRLRTEVRQKASASPRVHSTVNVSSAVSPPPHLPVPLTRFFGREAEIARLCETFGCQPSAIGSSGSGRTDGARLVTLTGPGGSGKTHLALQVGEALREAYDDAVWFVPLLDLSDPRLIPDKILQTLRLERLPQRDPLEQIAAALSGHPSLLILDNFEQLVGEQERSDAGGGCVQTLLERVRTLRILVTSRQSLGVPGEREFPVAPLPVPGEGVGGRVWGVGSDKVAQTEPYTLYPTPYSLSHCPSVQLFVDRAQAAQIDFQLTAGNAAAVAALCRQLEGIPLAIVLAAARVRVLTPQQMLDRLRAGARSAGPDPGAERGGTHEVGGRFDLLVSRQGSVNPRHRSLRAALDSSYQLLPPELQRFFARLSVFRGGWTLEAAEALCEAGGATDEGARREGPGPGRALEYLEELRQASLVITDLAGEEMRYRLLETLREYGTEQLTAAERTALAERHLSYYMRLVEKTRPGYTGQPLPQYLDQLEREHDNLRAALDWMVQSGGVVDWMLKAEAAVVGWDFIPMLTYFWWARGYTTEGRRRAAEVLALPGAAGVTAARASLLWGAGRLAHQQGDLATADTLVQESRAIYQELGDQGEELYQCGTLAALAREQGDYARARSLYDRVLAAARERGDEREIAFSLSGIGYTAYLEGELDSAQSLLEEALRILQAGQESAWACVRLGKAAETPYDFPAAAGHLTRLASACAHLGEVADARGDHPAARAHLEESLALFREFACSRECAYVLDKLGRVAQHQGQWQTARAYLSESVAFWQRVGNKPGLMACLYGLAAVAAGQGETERAARLIGAAAALRDDRSTIVSPVERADFGRVEADVRARLSEHAFAAAWSQGQSTPVEQIIAEALEAAPAGEAPP